MLDSAIFSSLTSASDGGYRTLDESFFEIAKKADDTNDYIMYKWRTGELFYDADGTGSGTQVKIAQLEERLSLDNTDFLVVDGSKTSGATSTVSVLENYSGDHGTESAHTGPVTVDSPPLADMSLDDIEDFIPGAGKILLDHAVFDKLLSVDGDRSGILDESQFRIAERAGDADDRIMYKWKTGELFYDADGTGALDQVLIGELDLRLSMDHSDFLII